ncbi:DUF3566 domain-containing protein [Streptomyces longwoodensis]|uniref:DUF3566 domain-containing protein n=1 Tax=Streptomyces longwoodensis TaxID=68231 RepID=UPI00386CD71E
MGRAKSARGRNTRRQPKGSGARPDPHGGPRPPGTAAPAAPAPRVTPPAQVARSAHVAPAVRVVAPDSAPGADSFPVRDPALPLAPPSGTTAHPSRSGRQLTQLDLWSVAATSALVCLALGVCLAVAASLTWVVIDFLNPKPEAGPSPVWGLTFLAVTLMVEVVLGTALATAAAYFYNLASRCTGGVHLRVRDSEGPSAVEVTTLREYRRLRATLHRYAAARLRPAAPAGVQVRQVAGVRAAEH